MPSYTATAGNDTKIIRGGSSATWGTSGPPFDSGVGVTDPAFDGGTTFRTAGGILGTPQFYGIRIPLSLSPVLIHLGGPTDMLGFPTLLPSDVNNSGAGIVFAGEWGLNGANYTDYIRFLQFPFTIPSTDKIVGLQVDMQIRLATFAGSTFFEIAALPNLTIFTHDKSWGLNGNLRHYRFRR